MWKSPSWTTTSYIGTASDYVVRDALEIPVVFNQVHNPIATGAKLDRRYSGRQTARFHSYNEVDVAHCYVKLEPNADRPTSQYPCNVTLEATTLAIPFLASIISTISPNSLSHSKIEVSVYPCSPTAENVPNTLFK